MRVTMDTSSSLHQITSTRSEPSDGEVVRKILSGSEKDFCQLISRYQKLVQVTIWNFFRSETFVDDIAQDVFIIVFQKLNKLKDPEKFKSWLMQITFNACIKQSKKVKLANKENNISIAETEVLPPDEQEEKYSPDEKALGMKMIESLSPIDGMIVWMKYVENLSFNDIADIVDATPEAIRQRASRSLRHIRNKTL